MTKTRMRVTFEDHGQDFLRWDIEDGVVVDCQPFQGWVWNGVKILSEEFAPGDKLKIQLRGGVASELRYPVSKIEEVKE